MYTHVQKKRYMVLPIFKGGYFGALKDLNLIRMMKLAYRYSTKYS